MLVASLLSTLLLGLAIIPIDAKSDLEPKSPMKLPLMKRRSLSKYNVMERDQRRSNPLIRRADGLEFDSNTNTSTNILPAIYDIVLFYVLIGVGNSEPVDYCKWLLHLVLADEGISKRLPLFTDNLTLDSGRSANMRLLHARLNFFFPQFEHLGQCFKPLRGNQYEPTHKIQGRKWA
jgi:hypothetical protein